MSKAVKRICKGCDNSFMASASEVKRGKGTVCSRRCLGLYTNKIIRKKKGPNWEKKTKTEYTYDYNKRNRNKYLARVKIANAVRRGKIIRPKKCSVCNRECSPEGHHKDHKKPFSVTWLCRTCHIALHKKNGDWGWNARKSHTALLYGIEEIK